MKVISNSDIVLAIHVKIWTAYVNVGVTVNLRPAGLDRTARGCGGGAFGGGARTYGQGRNGSSPVLGCKGGWGMCLL